MLIFKISKTCVVTDALRALCIDDAVKPIDFSPLVVLSQDKQVLEITGPKDIIQKERSLSIRCLI